MSDRKDVCRRKLTTPEAALRALPRHGAILLGFFAAQPPALVQALAEGAGRITVLCGARCAGAHDRRRL